MNRTLAALDREWAELDRSPATPVAMARWRRLEPALAGLPTLASILQGRTDPAAAPGILRALAALAVDDALAARTLLQALVPGLVRMASTSCSDDPDALDELVSLAWERIRTYPPSRAGSVAGNVLLDVRKRYRRERSVEAPPGNGDVNLGTRSVPSAEEVVCDKCGILDDLAAAERQGVINRTALTLIVRTRLEEVPLELAAAEQETTSAQANCIRWRAERRLRPFFALAG